MTFEIEMVIVRTACSYKNYPALYLHFGPIFKYFVHFFYQCRLFP